MNTVITRLLLPFLLLLCPAVGWARQPVILPLEVMYPVGSAVQVAVQTLAPARFLALSLHGIEIEGQAAVKVNDQPPIVIRNDTVKIVGPGLARSFPIGSSDVSYYKVIIPVSVNAGDVNLTFTLLRIDSRVSGFRVVKLDLLGADGKSVLAAHSVADDRPERWTAPLNNARDIAEGKRLFTEQDLVRSPLSSGAMRMHCADCHATDGSDLKYFNYSNQSIISRSLFHGLSENQGEQLASYIRNLATYQSKNGRPWLPPYQPAAGLDRVPVDEWAAGGGMEGAVLDDQAQMMRYLFPGFVDARKTPILPSAFLNPDNPHGTPDKLIFASTNIRELPIDLPLPDWNHWLPSISLREAVGGDAQFERSGMAVAFDGAFRLLSSQNGNVAKLTKVVAVVDDQGKHIALTDNGYKSLMDQLSRRFSNPVLSPDWVKKQSARTVAQALYSIALWKNVRTWQLQQGFHLDDKMRAIYENNQNAPSTLANSRIEPRGWAYTGLFSTSPGFGFGIDKTIANPCAPPGHSGCAVTGNELGEQYLRDVWYWLQLILNPGMGHEFGNNPLDWGYFPGALRETEAVTGESQYLRALAMTLKAMQGRDNGLSYVYGSRSGWNVFRLGDEVAIATPPRYLARPVVEAIENAKFNAWLVKNRSFSNEEWYAAAEPKRNVITDASLSPLVTTEQVVNSLTEKRFGYNHSNQDLIDQIRVMLPRMTCHNDLHQTERKIVDWLENLYPKVDWIQIANEKFDSRPGVKDGIASTRAWCRGIGGDDTAGPLQR
ncbi:Cytochrome c domain-containing protein [Burkholderia multivorans]